MNNKFMDFWQGNKTIICVGGLVSIELLKIFGVISVDQYSQIYELAGKIQIILGGGALYGLAMKGARTEAKIEQVTKVVESACNGKK